MFVISRNESKNKLKSTFSLTIVDFFFRFYLGFKLTPIMSKNLDVSLPKWRTGQKARREVFSRVGFVSTSEPSRRRRHLTTASVTALPATALQAALCSLPYTPMLH